MSHPTKLALGSFALFIYKVAWGSGLGNEILIAQQVAFVAFRQGFKPF
jgi:hypothetical protein